MDCDVCQKEEAKSKTLKLNKTKILQKAIIPSNKCWNCNLTFQDGDTQVKHFLDEHECQFCDGFYGPWFFEDPALKKKHFSEKHAICDHCGDVFEYWSDKEDHIEEKHKIANEANTNTAIDEQTNFQSTSKPRAGQKHKKVCLIQ